VSGNYKNNNKPFKKVLIEADGVLECSLINYKGDYVQLVKLLPKSENANPLFYGFIK